MCVNLNQSNFIYTSLLLTTIYLALAYLINRNIYFWSIFLWTRVKKIPFTFSMRVFFAYGIIISILS